MIQLAWPRSLQPLPGIVAGLLGSCRALLPGDWGFCNIRSCCTACRRRVVALLVQFPPWTTVWGLWVGAPGRPRPRPTTHAPRPRLAPGPPTHAPRPRLALQAARSTQLSVAFQAFVRNGSQPLHLGALICQRPLDAGVRHAQDPSNKCSAHHKLGGYHAVMHRVVTALSTVLTGVWALRARLFRSCRVSDKPMCLRAFEGTFVRGSTNARVVGVILTARSVHRLFPLGVPRSVAHNI